MNIKHASNFEEKCLQILNDCKTPRTLHYIKDKYNFSNKQIVYMMDFLEVHGLLTIKRKPKDGRGTKVIEVTDKGRVVLKYNGVNY